MADRMDSSHGLPVNGLSIWVGLTSFFTDTTERKRAHDMLVELRAARKSGRGENGSNQGLESEDLGKGRVEKAGGAKGAVRKFGAALGLRKIGSKKKHSASEADEIM